MDNLDKNITKKIQKVLLDIMIDIDKFCKQYDIEYFLVAGTALGARRHKGFIPWDDDIDIGMTYNNYIKFLEIAKDKLDNKYILQHYSVEKNFPQFSAKVMLKDSVFLEYSSRKLKIPHGFFIDIFPFYNLPDDDIELNKMSTQLEKLSRNYSYKKCGDSNYIKGSKSIQRLKRIVIKIIHYLLQIIPDSYFIKKYKRLTLKYQNVKTKRIGAGAAHFCLYITELYPIDKIKFESYEFNVPHKLDTYLERHFGKTYMQLPPVEYRFTHKPFKIVFPEEYSK